MKILKQIIQLLTCCLLLMAIAINKNQKILGTPLENASSTGTKVPNDEWKTDNGYRVITTKNIAKDIWGYGGNVPLLVYLKDNKISRIEIQPNSESPEFLSSIIENGLLSTWNNLSPEDAASKNEYFKSFKFSLSNVFSRIVNNKAERKYENKYVNSRFHGNRKQKENFI